jgi:23S rRNA (uracil1939-C5)-methyltransferase
MLGNSSHFPACRHLIGETGNKVTSPAPMSALAMNETLTIARLGQRGDGVAETAEGQVFVPFALPGERVRAVRDGEKAQLVEILTPSASRIAAICPLFTRCGGCAAQHMGEELYAEWKRRQVVSALSHAGIQAPVEPMLDAHGAGRRRVTFHARRVGD